MHKGLLIYGCYGYTGKLISEHAVQSGMQPTLAGRDAGRVKQMADELHLPYLVFDLDNEQAVVEHLRNFKVVLHCAGPFIHTAETMVNACLKAGTHYLDITGEFQVFEQIFKRDAEAQDAGILLMPGVGFDVVPSDCLSLYLKELLPTADSLELALYQKGGKLSHGTAITVAENLGGGNTIRRKGRLVNEKAGYHTRVIKVDDKERVAVAIPWGDISTAFRSTQIPNITVYNFVPAKVISSMRLSNYIGFLLQFGPIKRMMIKNIKKRPAGPDADQRQKAKTIIWGEVKNPLGITKQAILELPEGYTITAHTAVAIAQNILDKEPPHGAKTPAQVFGKNFILQFKGVSLTEQA